MATNQGSSSLDPEANVPPASETTPLLAPRDSQPDGQDNREIEPAVDRRQQYWVSIAFSVFLFAAFILLVILLALYRHAHRMAPTALCLTPACVHASDTLLRSLSPNYQSLDPCTNFEEYTCGGWREHHDLRPDQSKVGAFSLMADDADTLLRHILEGSYPGTSGHSSFSPLNLAVTMTSTDEENFNVLKRSYNACMDMDKIKEVGLKPLQKALKEFPVIKDTKDVSEQILALEKAGITSLVGLYAGADDKNPDNIVIFAGPRSGYGLPNPYYSRKDVLSQYQDVVESVLGAVHPDAAGRANSAKLGYDVVALEVNLANASPEREDMDDITKSYNPMSLKDTVKLAPALGIDRVLKGLVPSDYTVEGLITQFPDFWMNVSSIIEKTPKDTLQGFFYWKMISASAPYLSAPELTPWTQFQNKLRGKAPDAVPDRWRTCLGHADESLTWILSRFYVEAAFSERAKNLGDKIISQIKQQFITRIKALDWVDDSVKKLAIDKVNAIDQKVGYPTTSPNMVDPEALKAYYAGVNITDDFYDNMKSSTGAEVRRSWSALGKPVDHGAWGMSASTVNAYYSPTGNEIVFPAGVMQSPMFSPDVPSYLNYGAFGAVSGHELSHAFDNNGRHYDVHGRFTDWWTNATVEAFKKRAQCFVDEYSNLTVEGARGTEHVNGALTLGENLADGGGLHAAFEVWKSATKDQPDLSLPGLEGFTQAQVFYLSYGNVWCGKSTKEQVTQGILTDEHSPGSVRILGTAMLNSRGFREAFNCPVKEPVCELW